MVYFVHKNINIGEKRMKKFLSMVLAVVLLLSAVPMSVFASSDDDVTVSSVVIDPVESI